MSTTKPVTERTARELVKTMQALTLAITGLTSVLLEDRALDEAEAAQAEGEADTAQAQGPSYL